MDYFKQLISITHEIIFVLWHLTNLACFAVAFFISVASAMDGNILSAIQHLQKNHKQALRNSMKDYITFKWTECLTPLVSQDD